MDTSKLEKIENGKLPLWIRAGNFIDKIGSFFDKIEAFFTVAVGAVLILIFSLILTPLKILFEIITYLFRKK